MSALIGNNKQILYWSKLSLELVNQEEAAESEMVYIIKGAQKSIKCIDFPKSQAVSLSWPESSCDHMKTSK